VEHKKSGMCEPCSGPCKYAEGGEVPEKMDSDGDYDGDMEGADNELMDQCCDELLSAIESKNKKEMLDSLKAIILSCKG